MITYVRHVHGPVDKAVMRGLAMLERTCTERGAQTGSAWLRGVRGACILVVVGQWGLVVYAN